MDVDDEAFVETGEDPYHAEPPIEREPAEQPNMLLLYLMHYLSNPWILLIIFVLSYFYIFKKFWPRVTDAWTEWKLRREENRDLAEMVRNPDLYREKMEAMDLVRKRQQEQYEAAARLLAEREREKEEEKRRQRIQELENLASGQGYRNKSDLRGHADVDQSGSSGTETKIKKKTVLRPEYNPLMGDAGSSGSGSNFRRRGLGGAGGGG